MSHTHPEISEPAHSARPFPRAVEVDKPEGEPYRVVSVAAPLGESGAPLLDEVLTELDARGETKIQLHLDVAGNHFVSDPRIAIAQTERDRKEFLVLELTLARQLLHRG